MIARVTPGCRVRYWRTAGNHHHSGIVLSLDGDTAIIRPDHRAESTHHVSTRFEKVQIEHIDA